jgi:hypothetical protein
MYLDWIASGIGICGCYLVGKGKRYGWLLFASASSINIYIGYHAGMLGLAAGCACYFMLEIKGWWYHHHPKSDDKEKT